MSNYKNKKPVATEPEETPIKKETFWQKCKFYAKIVIVALIIWGIYFAGLATETTQVMAVASLIQSANMLLGFGTPLVILYIIYNHNHKK